MVERVGLRTKIKALRPADRVDLRGSPVDVAEPVCALIRKDSGIK